MHELAMFCDKPWTSNLDKVNIENADDDSRPNRGHKRQAITSVKGIMKNLFAYDFKCRLL